MARKANEGRFLVTETDLRAERGRSAMVRAGGLASRARQASLFLDRMSNDELGKRFRKARRTSAARKER